MNKHEDIANSYFGKEITPRDRAVFEAGIKLAAIFHQAGGLPITGNSDVIGAIQTALEKSFGAQPYVHQLQVKLLVDGKQEDKEHEYDYGAIGGKNLNVEVTIVFETTRVVAKLEFIPELQYPLMYIREIKEKSK